MKKQHLRAAALLLAAAMTAGGGTTAFAAEGAPTGPGLEIEQGQQLPPSQPEGQGQTGSGENQPDAQAPTEGNTQTGDNGTASTAPNVTVSYNQGVGTEVTSLSMNLNNYNGIGGVSYRSFVNNGGFIWWNHDGKPTGGTEASTYIEAIEIVLTGVLPMLSDIPLPFPDHGKHLCHRDITFPTHTEHTGFLFPHIVPGNVLLFPHFSLHVLLKDITSLTDKRPIHFSAPLPVEAISLPLPLEEKTLPP